ncbi:hypothetical protein AWC38_SpisGene16698 [Stylophora pistillata]|uniref:Uncharacterized protein n=1 Tax=Stylophora pistillata TaxID=50429 RepID=A0A2B4RQ21_STYPI|nr:hypothetical protein AWC38_SpisGene16698 [Stylophora pistillata]
MASESTSEDIEGSVFQVLEGVVYYVDPTTSSNAMNAFVGSKERVRIPLSGKHCSLQVFVKHVVEQAGLREEAQKRGLGSSVNIKLCRLEKGPAGNKAYAINTQAQWDEERSMFSHRGMVLHVCVAGGDVEPRTVKSAREKGKPGRKRSAAKEEDEQLVKNIKLGKEKDQMREWASDKGRAVRQRSVRQETTKVKAGTLLLNMYRSSYTPAEKVVFPAQPSPDDVETTASDIQQHDQQYDGSSDVSDNSEQVQEYDTDSDVSEHLSDDEDVLTFLRGIQTSSDRMVGVVRRLM